MADKDEPRGWFFDEEPQDDSEEKSEQLNPTQQQPQPPLPPRTPQGDPQQSVPPATPQQPLPPQGSPQAPQEPQGNPQQPLPPQPPTHPPTQQPGSAVPPSSQQPPRYVQQPGTEQTPPPTQGVGSIFDVAGTKSVSDKPEPDVDPAIEEQLKKEKRQQQVKVAIRGTIGFAGILALIYAGMFIYRMVTDVTPGSPTPEAVIESTFASLEEKDLLGVLRQLDPAETEPLFTNRDLFTSYFQQNEEIASASQPLDGFNISVSGLETRTTSITENLARVELVKGKISADVDETRLPRNASLEGDELKDIDLEEINAKWKEGNFNRLTGSDFDEKKLESENIFYVAINRGGRWYFSSTYTAAEYLRITANANGWDLGEPIFDRSVFVARGGSSPEEAVRNLINSTLELDSQSSIDMFSKELFPPIFEYRDVIQKAEDFNENNLYFRAVREGVELTDLNMTVRNLDDTDPNNPYRFVAINSLILNINYDLEVTTSDLENFGFVPYAARLLVNWDGRCLNTEGAYAVFESEEIVNEAPAFPIIDADNVEFTAQELNDDPDLAFQIVFPVIDANENVFEDADAFNGGTGTNYTPVTKNVDERECYRQNPNDFPEVGLMTVQEGSNYYISPIDTFWHFASWIITGNHTFNS